MSDLTTPAGRQEATLKREADRLASECVGAAALFTALRPHLAYDGHQLAMAHLATLETKRDAAVAAWQAAGEPVTYATGEQKQTIQRLLNDTRIQKGEKTQGLLDLPKLGLVDASAVIMGLKLTINDRAGYVVFPEVLGYKVLEGAVVEATYAVVGSAEVVKAKEAA